MKKRRLAALLCLIPLLAGCYDFFYPYPDVAVTPSPSPSSSPIILPSPAPRALTFGIAFSPSNGFHPLSDTLRHNDQAARLCYEGLFELDESFVPQPLLCVSMETGDNIHFTVTLREGVTFHDGSPLTASDVADSIRLAKIDGSPYAGRLSCVASASVQVDGTVLIVMNAHVWNAAALFDFPIVRDTNDTVSPGTGPYRAVLSSEGDYLLPFDGWWQEKPVPVERIELVSAGSADQLVYSFQYGYISMMPSDPWDTFSPGIHTGYDKISVPSGLMQYIGINTQRTPLDQKTLRQALALALDRRTAVTSVYGKDADAAVLPVPPSSSFYLEESAMLYRFDPGETARLIAGLGYTDTDASGILTRGRGRSVEALALDFIVNAGNNARVEMAEACAVLLRAVGFTVNVRALDNPAFEKALQTCDYDLYYAEARLAPSFDPREFLYGAFANETPSAEVAAALAEMALTDPFTDEGRSALAAVWGAIYDDLPFLTVCFRNTNFISQRGLLDGQTPTFYSAYYHFADWTVRER